MPPFELQYHRGGIFLPRLGLWLDAPLPQTGPERVFISHAHSDHIEAHREIILTAATAEFLRERIGGHPLAHCLPFRRPENFPGPDLAYQITLLPAGHIFGSAMSFLECGGESLLYTGDFKLRAGLSAEPCEPRRADILIMETTYGRPEYRFPPASEILEGIVRFCREALDNDETAVLLGYSLGKSQELLCSLRDAQLPLMLHGQVFRLTQIYQKFGQCFPPYERYDQGSARGKVLLCPPTVAGSAMLRNLGRVRVAVLTGWAADPDCRYRYQAHAAFPLSDHADFPELLKMVERVQPRKVLTLHGFAADFAQTLRGLGYDAEALSESEQLVLSLSRPSRRPRPASLFEPPPGAPIALAPPAGDLFRPFAETCAVIAQTSGKLEKVRILAGYLASLRPASVRPAAVWFTGYPFAPSHNKVLQVGWAQIRAAICARAQTSEEEFNLVYLKHSDLGETACELLSRPGQPLAENLTLEAVQDLFRRILSARGPLAKGPLLLEGLRKASPIEAKFLIKIFTSDLRIGLKEGLVEEAIAAAFAVPIGALREANLLLGDIGEAAAQAQLGKLAQIGITPFRPVKFMLASPEETARDIWDRVQQWKTAASPPEETAEAAAPPPGGAAAWVEDKYDGVRCQLHKVGTEVALYSRDLKNITATFHDLAEAARGFPGDLILDGEILAMRADQVLPFADLQKRLGRREGDLFLRDEIPVQFVAFDFLWRDGESYLKTPLARRRDLLEALQPLPPLFRLARVTQAASEAEIESAFQAARSRDNEGLMIKDPRSFYTPGRRGLTWLKLKKASATLDCVVVGAEYGHGKRKDVLSDYTFAVRDSSTGELKTIGKAYSGLTDPEIARLTAHFLQRVVRQIGRYHEVRPDTVLEIAFDRLQFSSRHNSGLAMRFPRIVRIRTDKTAAEIDTLEAARRLVKGAGK